MQWGLHVASPEGLPGSPPQLQLVSAALRWQAAEGRDLPQILALTLIFDLTRAGGEKGLG